jgi:hypothetical protein
MGLFWQWENIYKKTICQWEIIYKPGLSPCLITGIKNKSSCSMGRTKAKTAIPPLASYDFPDPSTFHSRMVFPTELIRKVSISI